jgi:hypothetical protein
MCTQMLSRVQLLTIMIYYPHDLLRLLPLDVRSIALLSLLQTCYCSVHNVLFTNLERKVTHGIDLSLDIMN